MTTTHNPVTWFEVGSADPDTARSFYGDLFGWTFTPQGPYTLIDTGCGDQGGVRDTTDGLGGVGSYVIPCVQVADVPAMTAKAEELGGKVVIPVTTTPDGLVWAHLADRDGSIIGVFTPPAAPAT